MNNDLKSRIMRRVYAIWFVRRIMPTAASLGFFMYLALRETAEKFFVVKIFNNFLAVAAHVGSVPGFIGAAMAHAKPEVLFIIAFSTLAMFILSVKLLRNIRTIVAHRNNVLGFDYQNW